MTPLKKFKILMSATDEHVYLPSLIDTDDYVIMITPDYNPPKENIPNYNFRNNWSFTKYVYKKGALIPDVLPNKTEINIKRTEIYDYLKENDLLDMKKFSKNDFTEFLLRFGLI